MGRLLALPEAAHLSLLDVSLPGSHDTLSYDLSLRVSDGGIDGLEKVAAALHVATDAIPDSLEDYIRQQGATQGLTVTQQLDSGIRFLDLRVMYEYTDKKDPQWYSLHLVESNAVFLDYLKEIRRWLDARSQEIVVLWISKHGNACDVGEQQYPKTSVEEKRAFWAQIEAVFAGLLFDAAESSISTTPLVTLLERKQRVVIMAADWVEFTDSSPFALDSCTSLTNMLGPGVSNETAAMQWENDLFSTFALSTPERQQAKAEKRFLLMSLSTAVPGAQMTLAALCKYLPGKNKELNAKCAEAFHVPGMTTCPQTLLDIAALENYYKQLTLDTVVTKQQQEEHTTWGYPNAIYINAVEFDGTVRTGTQVMWGKPRSADVSHSVSAYAYADSLVLFNSYLACGAEALGGEACQELKAALHKRRARHPLLLWSDERLGRKTSWEGVIP